MMMTYPLNGLQECIDCRRSRRWAVWMLSDDAINLIFDAFA